MSAPNISENKVLYIVSRGPYSHASGQEALDAALIGASFDLDVSILFIHDGVFQLKRGQNSRVSGLKEFTKTYNALEDFGIDKIYSYDLSLGARGLDSSELMCEVSILDSEGVKDLIEKQTTVLTF